MVPQGLEVPAPTSTVFVLFCFGFVLFYILELKGIKKNFLKEVSSMPAMLTISYLCSEGLWRPRIQGLAQL